PDLEIYQHENETKLPEFDWLPAAHGSGVGICLPSRCGDESLLRGNCGVADQVRLELGQLPGANAACGDAEAERLGLVRYAGQCRKLVPRETPALSGKARRADRRCRGDSKRYKHR